MYQSIDHAYTQLGNDILENGEWREGRNGKTLSLFGTTLKWDMADGFPMLNMRKLYPKGMIGEFISFLNDDDTLEAYELNGCPYWKKWAEPDGSLILDYPPREQLGYVIDLIKNDPGSRRMIIDLWNPDNRGKLSLDPCHTQYQFSVRNGKLHMIWTQRSVDYAIGAPSDFVVAALYLTTIANECGLEYGTITFNFGDTHLYEEHVKDFELLLAKDHNPTPIRFRNYAKQVAEFNKSSLELLNYNPAEPVKFLLKG